MRRSSVAHEKEGYLKVPIRMGVVNQVRESRMKGSVSPFHYPVTFGTIARGLDPLDPQHLASLAKNEDMKAVPWSEPRQNSCHEERRFLEYILVHRLPPTDLVWAMPLHIWRNGLRTSVSTYFDVASMDMDP